MWIYIFLCLLTKVIRIFFSLKPLFGTFSCLFGTFHFCSVTAVYSFSLKNVMSVMSSDPNIESSSPLSPGFMKNRGGRETADMSKERCGGLGRS